MGEIKVISEASSGMEEVTPELGVPSVREPW